MFGKGACSRPARQGDKNLIDQSEALLDLADAHPDPGVDVARAGHRDGEIEPVVRRVAGPPAGVDRAAASTADITGRRELARQLSAYNAGRYGTVLQRGGVVVKLDELRETVSNLLHQLGNALAPLRVEIAGDAARHDAVHHQAMAECGLAGAQRQF